MKVGNSQGSGPYHIQAEINMIPLIDVALVLLIIFMVISPMIVKSALNVNLPKVTGANSSQDETAVKVEIDAQGQMSLQGNVVARDNFKDLLKREFPPGHQGALLVQADKDVAFNDVVFVMDIAKQLKVEKLGVAVLPEQ